MEVNISYRKLLAKTRYGEFVCEIIERPIVKFGSYSDSEYGSIVRMTGTDVSHVLRINVVDEPNIIHSWNDILGIHLELMKKNALLAEQQSEAMRQAVQCYFHDSGITMHKSPNGERIPLWDGEWSCKEDGWIYTLERFKNEGSSYHKDRVIRKRNVKQADFDVEETQTKVMSRFTREFPLYPISPEGITAIFK